MKLFNKEETPKRRGRPKKVKEEIKIDFEELQLQRREEILKSGEYAKAEVIVGKGGELPIVMSAVRKVGTMEIAVMLKALLEMHKEVAKRCPEAFLLSMQIEAETETIEGKKNKKGERTWDL